MTLEQAKAIKLGQSKRMNNGHIATCIIYRGAKNADFQFEDGSISTHKAWVQFEKGTLKPPAEKRHGNGSKDKAKKKYIGTSVTCANSLTATCIAYNDSHDLTIQWPDGTTREHVTLSSFRHGIIKKEGITKKTEQAKTTNIGRTNTANNGMDMEIIDYTDSRHMTVHFKDGTILEDIRSGDFNNGNITHPLYPSRKGKVYGKKIRIGCIDRGQLAYNCRLANYYCECNDCGLSDIMDWKDIHAHNATHGIPAEQLTWQYIQNQKEGEENYEQTETL